MSGARTNIGGERVFERQWPCASKALCDEDSVQRMQYGAYLSSLSETQAKYPSIPEQAMKTASMR